MIKQLNKVQYTWIESTLLMYYKSDYNIEDGVIRRLNSILDNGDYDDGESSYDMKCIDVLKLFYIHTKKNVNIWVNDLSPSKFIAGYDTATGDSSSAVTWVTHPNGRHQYIKYT